eukprot:1063066-Pelagomonas_calceolata.AAC.12
MGGAAGAAAAGLQGQGIAPAATGSAIVVVVAGGGGLGHEGGSCKLRVHADRVGHMRAQLAGSVVCARSEQGWKGLAWAGEHWSVCLS